MAAIIPDGGWGGPHQDPPSIMPGPSNPWAMCTDTGNDPFISNEELGESPLPLMGEPAWPKQPCSGGLWFIGVGLTITGVLTAAAAVAGAVIFAAEFAAAGIFMNGIFALGAFGIALTAGGTAAMLSSFDPAVFDHTAMVPVPDRRKLTLPQDLPAPLRKLVEAGAEIAFLNDGAFDVRDHARAAAAAGDATSYEDHLKNLFLIEDNMQARVTEAADLLDQIADHPALKLDQAPVDTDQPVFDMVNPAAAWRPALVRMGLDSAMITQAVGLMRADPLVATYLRPTLDHLMAKHGATAQGMLKGAAEMLRAREMIEWEAFGGKPA